MSFSITVLYNSTIFTIFSITVLYLHIPRVKLNCKTEGFIFILYAICPGSLPIIHSSIVTGMMSFSQGSQCDSIFAPHHTAAPRSTDPTLSSTPRPRRSAPCTGRHLRHPAPARIRPRSRRAPLAPARPRWRCCSAYSTALAAAGGRGALWRSQLEQSRQGGGEWGPTVFNGQGRGEGGCGK